MYIKFCVAKYLFDVCPIVFGLKLKDVSSPFSFNSVSVYANKGAPTKQEGLEFNSRKGFVGVALIYSHHRIVLEATIL
jgi:hypothetical protein